MKTRRSPWTSTGTISFSNLPSSIAASARRCDSSEYSSSVRVPEWSNITRGSSTREFVDEGLDRDYVEPSNLQRQSLFDEADYAKPFLSLHDQMKRVLAAGRAHHARGRTAS